MSKNDFALGNRNLMILGVALLFVIVGFTLMAVGPASSLERGFEPDIFSTRRIVVAPMVVLFGFLLGAAGILIPQKKEADSTEIKK